MPEIIQYNTVQQVAAAMIAIGRDAIAICSDADGTILDYNIVPDDVKLPANTRDTIKTLYHATGGRFAFITGRNKEFIDRELDGFPLPASFQHGAEARLSFGGAITSTAVNVDVDALEQLIKQDFPEEHPDIWFEKKSHAIAVHWNRSARPDWFMAPAVQGFTRKIADIYNATHQDAPVHAQRGKQVFEIGTGTKGKAMRDLMRVAPFHGCVPFYMGDHIADESAMEVAQEMAVQMGYRIPNTVGIGPEAPAISQLRLEFPSQTREVLDIVAKEFSKSKQPALRAVL